MAERGSVNWPFGVPSNQTLWTFNWALEDGPDDEGIVISNAVYQGHQVFFKGSLPLLRVWYPIDLNQDPTGSHYELRDDLCYNNARPHQELEPQGNPPLKLCPADRRVCVASVSAGGHDAVIVQTYYSKGIGCYRITQQWIFWGDGTISPRFYSRGIQHPNRDHTHNPYWRFNFDIDGSQNNQVLSYQDVAGIGPTWVPFVQEGVAKKQVFAPNQPSWAVWHKGTERGYYIYPGPHDGVANAFSTEDLWVLRFKSSEDRHGDWGTGKSDNLMTMVDGENVDGQDVVLYYCAHLFHNEHAPSPAGEEWLFAGPDLVPFGWESQLAVKLELVRVNECNPPVEGGTLEVHAIVTDAPPFDSPPFQFQWTVVGAQPIPSGATNANALHIQLPSPPNDVSITVVVTVGPQQASQTITVPVATHAWASTTQRICQLLDNMRHYSLVQTIIHPLGPDTPDIIDLREILTLPDGVVEINRIAQKLAQVAGSEPSLVEINRIARELEEATNAIQEGNIG